MKSKAKNEFQNVSNNLTLAFEQKVSLIKVLIFNFEIKVMKKVNLKNDKDCKIVLPRILKTWIEVKFFGPAHKYHGSGLFCAIQTFFSLYLLVNFS